MRSHLIALLFPLLAAPALAQQYVQRVTRPTAPGSHPEFGTVLALDEGRFLTGAPYAGISAPGAYDGAAYVYEHGPAGWVEVAELTGSDTAPGDRFGTFVTLRRDVAALSPANASAVYVFERNALGWTEVQKLESPPTSGGFGRALALSDDQLFVGATNDPDLGPGAGKVFVFERTPAGWVETEQLVASDGATPGGVFGYDIAVDGAADRMVIGRAADGHAGQTSGSAYVFEREPTGWTEVAKLTASNAEAGDRFGEQVAIDDDHVVIGARGKHVNFQWAGGAYVFRRLGSGTWAQDGAMLRASDRAEFDKFGSDVAISQGRVVVGASGDDGIYCPSGPFCEIGSLYTFHRSQASWEQTGKLIAPEDFPITYLHDQVGISIGLEGTRLLSGAPGNESGVGAVFEFELPNYSTPYGFCAEDGPCANDDAFGGCANSTGDGAYLWVAGSGSVSADDLVMTAINLQPGQFGLMYMGGARTLVPFGDGLRLVDSGLTGTFRFDAQSSGPGGLLVEGPGIVAHSQTAFSLAGHIAAGDIWRFQAWYRDPAGPCGSGFNLSNAVEIVFRP